MKPKQNLSYKILIKLNENDRKIAEVLREKGINVTQLFRLIIREKYEKMIADSQSLPPQSFEYLSFLKFQFINYLIIQSLWIFSPPLISNIIPVEKFQSPLEIDATAFPISSGMPHRFCGTRPSLMSLSYLSLIFAVISV